MTRSLIAFAVVIGICASAGAESLGVTLGRGETGEVALAGEVVDRLAAAGMAVEPTGPVSGADALMAARYRPGVHLAVVHDDLPAYLRARAARGELDPAALETALGPMQRLIALPPLTVHVLAKPGTQSLSALDGARIGIGPADSAGAATAARILERAGIAPATVETGSLPDGIAGLMIGALDALIVVDRLPSVALSAVVLPGDPIALVPIANPALEAAGYVPTLIEAGDYPFAEASVPTVGVGVSVVAYAYRSAVCGRLARAAEALAPLSDLALTDAFAPHPCATGDTPAALPAPGDAANPPTAAAAGAEGDTEGGPDADAAKRLFDAIGNVFRSD
ncbi:MAG: TAXI family TRAP transporter solute-binding subunit [Paracoccaceae bacterium]